MAVAEEISMGETVGFGEVTYHLLFSCLAFRRKGLLQGVTLSLG